MTPKTPRTKAASKAPTTGHIASPATIVIRKKLASTPAPLPKRGRKSMGLTKVCFLVFFYNTTQLIKN